MRLVSHEVTQAPVVNETSFDGTWLDCGPADLTRPIHGSRSTSPRLCGMLAGDLARARRWRLHVREIFTHYFHAGYRVVDFTLHRDHIAAGIC